MAPASIDSLSNHTVTAGERVKAYGTGFADVTGVQVGDAWATDFVVDGSTIITFTTPEQPGGSTAWIVVHLADGSTSPCVGNEQLVAYANPLDQPPGELRIDSIVPSTITIGRPDVYWLTGSGFTNASAVIVDDAHACTYQNYDDGRLMVNVPLFAHDDDTKPIKLVVMTQNSSAELSVPCVSERHATPQPLSVFGVEPTMLPKAGGQITISGTGLDAATWVGIGNAQVTIDSQSPDSITATVGSLADYAGQTVGVEVGNTSETTGITENHQIHVIDQ